MGLIKIKTWWFKKTISKALKGRGNRRIFLSI